MKIISLVLIELFFIKYNCFSQEYPDEKTVQGYKEIISLYPEDLVSHFPKEIAHEKVLITAFKYPKIQDLSYIHIMLILNDTGIETLKKDALLEAKAIYHFTDSCLMIIPYNYEDNSTIINTDSIRYCQNSNMLPISNIRTWGDFVPDFYKNAIIFIFNAEKGCFLKNDYLSKSGVGLPNGWQHGYSKGIVIFKNYVMYWLDVW